MEQGDEGKEGTAIKAGVFCDRCGKALTENEYSRGECDCGGSAADESELVE